MKIIDLKIQTQLQLGFAIVFLLVLVLGWVSWIQTAQIATQTKDLYDHPLQVRRAIGKLTADPREILAALEPAGFLVLPVTGEHAARVAGLPAVHRDPFDRMLVAQALCEPMRLLTTDRVLAGYGEIVTVV